MEQKRTSAVSHHKSIKTYKLLLENLPKFQIISNLLLQQNFFIRTSEHHSFIWFWQFILTRYCFVSNCSIKNISKLFFMTYLLILFLFSNVEFIMKKDPFSSTTQLFLIIVKWGKKQTILTNLLFYEIRQHLNIKIGFQAVKIYFLTFSSCFFTFYLQPIRNKLLKTSSVFYPTKWGKYHL